MAQYQIITDSCCDFTRAQYEALGVPYASLTVMYNGEPHDSFSEPEELKDFYNGIRRGAAVSTSAVNPEGWQRIMRPILEDGRDVLVIAFAAVLSTTHQSAVIAAQDLAEKYPHRKIRVVDSTCVAHGQGLLVTLARKLQDTGTSLEEVAAWVEENKKHVIHWIIVDDPNHLKRGGRLSADSAKGSGILGIKPIIRIDDSGKLDACDKVRGTRAAVTLLAKKLEEQGKGFDNETVYIGHGDCPDMAQALADLLKKKYGVRQAVIGYVGGVIGAHLGPDTLCLFFMGNQR